MYASSVETAAMMNTARKLIAYESRAARCSSGGSLATRVEEWRILLISCNPGTSASSGSVVRLM